LHWLHQESAVLRLLRVILSLAFFIASAGALFAQTADSNPRLLPERVGEFRQVSPNTSNVTTTGFFEIGTPVAAEQSEFVGRNGVRVFAGIARFRQDAYAYEVLTLMAAKTRTQQPDLQLRTGYGTAGFASPDEIAFFKGTHYVSVRNLKSTDAASLEAFAIELSQGLDKGEGDIPALIKHLPNPEEGKKNAVYLSTFSDLTQLGLQQPVLSAIQSGGNADAVLASYGPSKVLIVEFNTPQLASDNDQRIITRIHELWKLGQPAPTAYRRVGNYSVFVFDSPNEQTAKQLIDQVKYEQVVQWLGENPNIFKEAEKRYINTTLGVLVAVVKASGYALVACLGLGALFGGLLFSYRRAQQKDVEAFSDAGGMLRLNLDELTAETDPSRLLSDRN
jgi:hypothetical protein